MPGFPLQPASCSHPRAGPNPSGPAAPFLALRSIPPACGTHNLGEGVIPQHGCFGIIVLVPVDDDHDGQRQDLGAEGPPLSPETTPSEAGLAALGLSQPGMGLGTELSGQGLGTPWGKAQRCPAPSCGRGAGTWRWTERLLGVRATVVLNRTAHFSSVTDSDPFRSQRLIFFSSWGGES